MTSPTFSAPHDLDVFTCPLDGIRLIEASAGTGKTWNICGLYLRLLLERELPVEEILVVTFTRAATAELKSRIRERIVETLGYLAGVATSKDPFVAQLIDTLEGRGLTRDTITARLDNALQVFDEAAIFTIHGYCQRALAETPFAAALPFALELADNDLELRLEVTRDFWRRHIAAEGCSAELGELLMQKKDSPERWAELLGKYLARPLAEKRWPDAGSAGGGSSDASCTELAAAFAGARVAWGGDGAGPTGVLLAALESMKANIYKPESIAVAATSWSQWLTGGDPLAPVDLKNGKHDLLSAERVVTGTKTKCTAPAHPFFDLAARVLALRGEFIAQLKSERLALLRRFLEEASTHLRAVKRERRLIAFDDILFNAHEALTSGENPWLAADLHRRYPAALIDEFQDTDPLQFEIFRRIYADGERRGSLFLVGDPKQAIYSFRNADLHTYLQAREQADAQYTLRQNQRSVGGMIDACNALFQANPAAFVLEGLAYEAVSEGAKPRKPFVDASCDGHDAALRVWWLPSAADGQPILRRDAMARVPAATAAEIARLIAGGQGGEITLGGRGLAPGDIAVLVKSHAQGARMREALAARGVGSVELSQRSVFASDDAEELERVLLAIAEPARQPLLFAALATTLMGHDAAAISNLAADEAGLLHIMARFAALRDLWLTRGFGVMLRRWIEQEGVNARLLVRDDGERRLTNLLHLAECLHEAAREHASPDVLLRWFASRRREADRAEATQLRLESDRNLVQIVTVHRAKGLEYAVVFCPYLWDGHAASRDDGEGCTYHEASPDDGRERLVLDFRPEAKSDDTLKAEINRERDAEYLRLAYVAMTRAVYRCYLVAGCYGKPTRNGQSNGESVRSLLNWLVAGGAMPHADWRSSTLNKLEPDAIEAAWLGLAEASAPNVRISELPDGSGAALPPVQGRADALNALAPPAHLPNGWRIGSFSGLSHGAERDEAARDHDARAPTTTPALPPPALDDDDILYFPRGPVAGECIHAVFEYTDFTRAETREPAITAALAAHPQRSGGDELLRRMLHRMAADVLATPLADGIVLNTVSPARMLVELGFHLPVPALSAPALNDWLKRHGYGVPRLGFGALEGYLKGYIDLVFEHDGRFYVLDWKSNHLGFSPEDYAPERLEAAMQGHGYHLQHLLYSVALHRHLAATLPGYDFDAHFGGVLYLFVRGVRPGWQLAGAPAGVYFHRVPAETLASLDALIGGAKTGRAGVAA